ncbi:MAG TPA: D-glycero-beta-D-manno-heptose-7-phosphate kinase [Sulfurovum sp.]|jgi:D-beta-D-heptose 7-phosphate kinase/D-beta-D-heptose 1-phosphate adenosyltransferase|nr:MAG: bifunctional heptose 7-phosphate kinase/heptose 1-phosphate adenyltransferase [Sulfurovum sp. 35-42-20]OYZ25056.1 MAG: bifunctional heptose 7-phosphate kinase/heptose 1-phosphate adenyltransferase [Sulfurovum sp. 16-42-52]OYZ48964.1 MAG: bifunctional heptose 7-phosphate kinase/heptose 1-phosphate adenyltransferase [Sulfurovum sp. 24-42-9]OZA44823.1 MAG: bifunctional heptose 7-phosphate kinase/heptose 1-phosphate adenyltransferase [Sulfurovum sp. 17-42-90]OZA61104.1 MAG: bifunctional hep
MIDLRHKTPHIVVIGDLMIDHYLWGKCERISPEAPVQVVAIEKETSVLGGAGNVINNLAALGAKVDVISVIGGDSNAAQLRFLLHSIEVNDGYLVTEIHRNTSKKSRIIASQQQVVRYDQESTEDISLETQKTIFDTFMERLSHYDMILLSDYGKGVLTDALTQKLIHHANAHGKKVLVDPKGEDYSKYTGAYLLTPNKKEAILASKINITDEASLLLCIKTLKEKCDLDISLITLSEDGIALFDGQLRVLPTVAREVYDVTGAGDTVLASLGFALACGYSIDQAVGFANLAAGVVVGKIGSATATLDEIIAYESSLNKSTSDLHIKTLEEMTSLSKELRKRGKKIVFTNGCFDILHVGHVKYLEAAKSYGDVLIVGLNSDESVSRLKGPTRPVNTEDDRAYILASLEAVDYVVKFYEDTPYELINALKPHILVKGGDYAGKDVVGQDIVDELRLVDFVQGKSTTKTIEKIKEHHENNHC